MTIGGPLSVDLNNIIPNHLRINYINVRVEIKLTTRKISDVDRKSISFLF